MGRADEKNRLMRNMTIFVLDICEKVQTGDCERQNILQFFCVTIRFITNFLATKG